MTTPRVQGTALAVLFVLLFAVLAFDASTQGLPGDVLAHQKISATQGGFTGKLHKNAWFGQSVAPLGDLDGDGNQDLAVGVSGDDDEDDPHGQHGSVWILLLRDDGTVKSQVKISVDKGGFDGLLDDKDEFGHALTGLGDLDGDGVTDLAVGSRQDDDGGKDRGAVWILFLNPDGTVKSTQKISDTQGGFLGTLLDGDGLGSSVALLPDLNGDGIPALAVGAAGDGDGGPGAGATWVLFLNGDGTVASHQKISGTQGGFTGLLHDGDGFGGALASIGDLDEDGVIDLAVGAPADDDGGIAPTADRGAVWVLFLNGNGTVASQQKISDMQGGFGGALQDGDGFGGSLAALGDLNGDGSPDLAVGAPFDDDGDTPAAVDRGAVWTLFLQRAGTVAIHHKISASQGDFSGTLDDGDTFGSSVTALGDLTEDGVIDLAVGARMDDDGGKNQGAVWIVFLAGASTSPPFTQFTSALEGKPGRPALIMPTTIGPDQAIDKPIIVVGNDDSTSLTVLELSGSETGDVSFASLIETTTGDKPAFATSDDFNEDGAGDIVTANRAGGIAGTGSFSYLQSDLAAGTPPFRNHVEFDMPAVNGTPIAIGTGDFDLDSHADLAIAGDGGVSVFLGNGLGGFTERSFTPVTLLTDLVVGDVNNDGHLDVVTASGAVANAGQQEGFATVLLGDGTGGLVPSGTFASGRAIVSVLLADTDGTGVLDAMVSVHEFAAGPAGEPQGRIDLYLGTIVGTQTTFTKSPIFPGLVFTSADGVHPAYGAVDDVGTVVDPGAPGDPTPDGLPDFLYTSSDNISYPADAFISEQPHVTATVLVNDGAGSFVMTVSDTAYVGKGTTPILADLTGGPGVGDPPIVFPDGNPDSVVVWHTDTLAGQGPLEGGSGLVTFITVLQGEGDGSFIDPAKNQGDTGNGPGTGDSANVDNGAADGLADSPDILVPNRLDNSFSVFLGNGTDTPPPALTVSDVDVVTTPPVTHVGGPVELRTAHLNGDSHPDVVVYSQWVWDESAAQLPPDPEVLASLSLFLGDGLGGFAPSQSPLPLPRGGAFAVADLDGDGHREVLVTQRVGLGGPDELRVYGGLGTGLVATAPEITGAPAGMSLAGGLVVADVNGDGEPDVLTTAVDDTSHLGSLLVYLNTAGMLTPQLFDLADADWTTTRVRSMDVGDLNLDGIDDVAIGAVDGRLFLAAGVGDGTFSPLVTNAAAKDLGGGALRMGDLNGDGVTDIISCNGTGPDETQQAMVRLLKGIGNGTFLVLPVGGLSSAGLAGTLRPILSDLDGNEATDMVLSHGLSNEITILLNGLSGFESYGVGKPGSGGIMPVMKGTGYSTPAGRVVLSVANGVGNGLGFVQVGIGRASTGFLAVQTPFLHVALLFRLDGVPGVPGVGTTAIEFRIPDVQEMVGLEFTLQALILDPNAGPPGPSNLSASNGVAMLIKQ